MIVFVFSRLGPTCPPKPLGVGGKAVCFYALGLYFFEKIY